MGGRLWTTERRRALQAVRLAAAARDGSFEGGGYGNVSSNGGVESSSFRRSTRGGGPQPFKAIFGGSGASGCYQGSWASSAAAAGSEGKFKGNGWKGVFRSDARLADYCTLGVGGPAKLLVEVHAEEELAAVLRYAADAVRHDARA